MNIEQIKQMKIGDKVVVDYYSMENIEAAKLSSEILSLDYTWTTKKISQGVIEHERVA